MGSEQRTTYRRYGLNSMLGGAGGVKFTDDFSSLKAGWSANLSVSGGQAIVTPTQTLVLDENFDDWTGDDPDGWTISFDVDGSEVTQRNPGEFNADAPGTGAANIYAPTDNSMLLSRAATLTTHAWYIHFFDEAVNTGRLRIFYGPSTVGLLGTVTHVAIPGAMSAMAFDAEFQISPTVVPVDRTIDRVRVWRMSDFVAYRDCEFVEGSVSADTVLLNRTSIGVAHYIDDDNYVMALMHQSGTGNNASGSYSGQVFLIKVVGGVMSELASTGTPTTAASYNMQLTRSGNDYSVSINDVSIFTATAVNDAVFETATTWGMFSLHADNRFNSFEAVAA